MNLHTYESSSGKDLIMEYILGLPEMERIDALSENIHIKGGVYMPFTGLDVNAVIEREKIDNPEFARLWDESRTEYKLLGEMIRLRKEQKITQAELSEVTGYKQQVISRIEKRENSPTLKTFCNLLNALGYDLKIIKKI